MLNLIISVLPQESKVYYKLDYHATWQSFDVPQFHSGMLLYWIFFFFWDGGQTTWILLIETPRESDLILSDMRLIRTYFRLHCRVHSYMLSISKWDNRYIVRVCTARIMFKWIEQARIIMDIMSLHEGWYNISLLIKIHLDRQDLNEFLKLDSFMHDFRSSILFHVHTTYTRQLWRILCECT